MKKICGGVVMLLILLSGSTVLAMGSSSGNLCSIMTGPFKEKCSPSFDSGKNLCAVSCKDDSGSRVYNTLKLSRDKNYYIIQTESKTPVRSFVRRTRSFGCIDGTLYARPI